MISKSLKANDITMLLIVLDLSVIKVRNRVSKKSKEN
jgi:hypothetical protein